MAQQKEHTHRRLPICTLGAHGHGKTTLTAAIAKVVARIGAIHTNGDSDFEAQTPISHPIREGVGITYRAIAYETSGKTLHTNRLRDTHRCCQDAHQRFTNNPGGNLDSKCSRGDHTGRRGTSPPCQPDATPDSVVLS